MKAITREEKIISGENLTPITRKEMFLAKASGQNIQTPTPITREEIFLSKITGGGGSVEGTAIPVGEKVENIYINYQLPHSEINAYLSQLTYVDIGTGVPMSFIYGQTDDGETGVFIFVEERDGEYGVVISSSLDLSDARLVCASVENQTNESLGTSQNIFLVQANNVIHQIKLIDLNATVLTEFMGLPIGAENEKIKNVLSITPFGASGGTSTNKPTAYTVSSVDELPSNAVDGSLAIVEAESTAETWVFHDELDNLGESYTAWYDEETSNCISPFNIEYSNYDMGIVIGEPNKVWKEFSVGASGPSSWGIYVLNAVDDEIGATVDLYMHNPNGDYGFPHGWKDDKFKTIQVHYADEEARQWLEAHATSLGKAIIRELYTRQNGKWVYTGEVA